MGLLLFIFVVSMVLFAISLFHSTLTFQKAASYLPQASISACAVFNVLV